MARKGKSQINSEASQAGGASRGRSENARGDSDSGGMSGDAQGAFPADALRAFTGFMQMWQSMQHQQSFPYVPPVPPAPPVAPAQQDPPVPLAPSVAPVHQDPAPLPVSPQSWPEGGRSFSKFKSLAPAPFAGSTNPIQAEEWIVDLERAFVAHGSSEEERIRFATFLLRGEAYNWWVHEESRHSGQPITWKDFKTAFHGKYFPRSVRIQMEAEFFRLGQQNMTVAQYEAEFSRLARFTPTLVPTEEARICRFIQGLRPRLMQVVNSFELTTYEAVVNKALLVERDLNEVQRDRDQRQKRKGPSDSRASGKPKKKPAYRPTNQQGREAVCSHCGSAHPGRPCGRFAGSCYHCGKLGHRAVDCRLRKSQQPPSAQGGGGHQLPPPAQGGAPQQPRTQGRVFTLTQQDAAASNSVVTGALLSQIV